MKNTARRPARRRSGVLARQIRKRARSALQNEEAMEQPAGTAQQRGPLGYSVAVALMSIRPLLRVLREEPERLSIELIESVTPLLEQLEARLQYCQACQTCGNLPAKPYGILQ